MEKVFNVTEKSDVWIYGAGYRGLKVAEALLSYGCSVSSFVDRNAQNIKEKGGIKVVTFDAAVKSMKEDSVLIICLSNGMEQQKVAKRFFESSIRNILYLPMDDKISIEKSRIYRKKYFSLLMGEIADLKNIPVYELANDDERYIIKNAGKQVLFWCDIDCIYSSFYIQEQSIAASKDSKLLMQKYANIPMNKFYPYINLFRNILDDSNDCIDEYVVLQGRTSKEDINYLIEDRKKLFSIYEWSYKYDMSFFLDSPPLVQWNDNGYFNVCDGMHRIQFFLFKKNIKVPVTTSVVDYNKYMKHKNKSKC